LRRTSAAGSRNPGIKGGEANRGGLREATSTNALARIYLKALIRLGLFVAVVDESQAAGFGAGLEAIGVLRTGPGWPSG